MTKVLMVFFVVITMEMIPCFLAYSQENDNPIEVTNFSETDYDKIKVKDGKEVIPERNPKTGIYDLYYPLDEDLNRHTILLKTNLNPLRIAGVLGADYNYGRKITDFWLELFVSYLRAEFGSISVNPTGIAGAETSDYNHPRPDTTPEGLISFGAGAGYLFHFPDELNFLMINNLFHSAKAFATYNQLNESYRGFKYNGFGLRADYGVFKRFSSKLHIGPHFGYHIALVSRGQLDPDENGNDRKLLLSWMTLGLDLSYYF